MVNNTSDQADMIYVLKLVEHMVVLADVNEILGPIQPQKVHLRWHIVALNTSFLCKDKHSPPQSPF